VKQLTNVIAKGAAALPFLLFSHFLSAQQAAEEVSSLNLRRGATDISGQVYDLHMLMFFICVGIAVVVFGVMFASMYLHRKSRGGYTDAKLFKIGDWFEPHQVVTDDCGFSVEIDGEWVNLSWYGEWINTDGGCANDDDLAPFLAASKDQPIEGVIYE
jgi:hypothetical protein